MGYHYDPILCMNVPDSTSKAKDAMPIDLKKAGYEIGTVEKYGSMYYTLVYNGKVISTSPTEANIVEKAKRHYANRHDKAKDASWKAWTLYIDGKWVKSFSSSMAPIKEAQKFMKENYPGKVGKLVRNTGSSSGYSISGSEYKDAAPADVRDASPIKVKRVVKSQKSNNGVIYYIIEDVNGNLWVTTDKSGKGGATFELSMSNAERTLKNYITIENLESKYGKSEGHKRWMRGETDTKTVVDKAIKCLDEGKELVQAAIVVDPRTGKREPYMMYTNSFAKFKRELILYFDSKGIRLEKQKNYWLPKSELMQALKKDFGTIPRTV